MGDGPGACYRRDNHVSAQADSPGRIPLLTDTQADDSLATSLSEIATPGRLFVTASDAVTSAKVAFAKQIPAVLPPPVVVARFWERPNSSPPSSIGTPCESSTVARSCVLASSEACRSRDRRWDPMRLSFRSGCRRRRPGRPQGSPRCASRWSTSGAPVRPRDDGTGTAAADGRPPIVTPRGAAGSRICGPNRSGSPVAQPDRSTDTRRARHVAASKTAGSVAPQKSSSAVTKRCGASTWGK